MKTSEWPFPYVGAGEARYFEWAEVAVWFLEAPTKAAKARIAAALPAPLATSLKWTGKILLVGSAQFVNVDITNTYGKGKKVRRRSRSHWADAPAVAAFNTAIETWLLSCHELCPIAMAFRRQDSEAGGTTLSEWHRESLERHAEFLPLFESALAAKRKTNARQVACGVLLELVEADPDFPLNAAQSAAIGPIRDKARDQRARSFKDEITSRDSDKWGKARKVAEDLLIDQTDRMKALHEIGNRLTSWNETLNEEAAELVTFLARPHFPPSESLQKLFSEHHWCGKTVYLVYQAAIQIGDKALAKSSAEVIRSLKPEASVGFLYLDLIRGGSAKALHKLVDEALDLTGEDFYKGALWSQGRDPIVALDLYGRAAACADPPWQAVNNGIALLLALFPGQIPSEQAKAWLARGLKHSEAPCQHNTACLLARLGEKAKAEALLLQAVCGGADLKQILADAELITLLESPSVVEAIDLKVSVPSERLVLEGIRLATLGRPDDAIESLVAAITEGADASSIRALDACASLRDHKGWRRLRARKKKP